MLKYQRKHPKIRELPKIEKEKPQKVAKSYVLKRSKIRAIWTRKKRRLAEFGGENTMFLEIWNDRPHICEECRWKIPEMQTFCFAHKLSKWVFPEFRMIPENIALVCSISCHAKVDKRYQWENRKKLLDYLSKKYGIESKAVVSKWRLAG